MICAVLDGLAPGIPVDEAFVARKLQIRRPAGPADTARREPDPFRIVSGVLNGCTTGAPITILIPNSDVRSSDYDALTNIPRPSHADYTAQVKYGGFQDKRGGGHFSGRVTVGLVAAGAIAMDALRRKGVLVGTHILECGGVKDVPFADCGDALKAQIERVGDMDFPVISDVRGAMEEAVAKARAEADSVGGIVQTAVCGLSAGVGEPWFDSLDGALANALFSIGGVKGVEFGAGFGLASMRGSEANDAFCISGGRVATSTNRSGGINGGISNGMPLIINSVVKPTPSIGKPQRSIDMQALEEVELRVPGRHDPAIVRRVCVVASSVVALVLCDQLVLRFGTDYLR